MKIQENFPLNISSDACKTPELILGIRQAIARSVRVSLDRILISVNYSYFQVYRLYKLASRSRRVCGAGAREGYSR